MQSIDKEHKNAHEDSLIKEFLLLVKNRVGDGIIDFKHICEKPFMKFWQNMAILKYEPEIDNFRIIQYGTQIVNNFGTDCTGMLLSEVGIGDTYNEALSLNKKTIQEKQWVYLSGNLSSQKRDFVEYNQVKIPMMRNGEINELIMCVNFNITKNVGF